MFISDATAADSVPAATTAATTQATSQPLPTGDAAGEPSPALSMMPLLLIFIVFYFLLIRPQQKRMREHESMVKGLNRGDKIVTGGGIVGVVQKVEDNVLVVEIAPEVRIRVMRDTISHLYTQAAVANDNKSEGK